MRSSTSPLCNRFNAIIKCENNFFKLLHSLGFSLARLCPFLKYLNFFFEKRNSSYIFKCFFYAINCQIFFIASNLKLCFASVNINVCCFNFLVNRVEVEALMEKS